MPFDEEILRIIFELILFLNLIPIKILGINSINFSESSKFLFNIYSEKFSVNFFFIEVSIECVFF